MQRAHHLIDDLDVPDADAPDGDTRLPEAVERLNLGHARIVEVTRAERSVVTLRPGSDPVSRHLDDAYALSRNEEALS